jgi:hypothetical protein
MPGGLATRVISSRLPPHSETPRLRRFVWRALTRLTSMPVRSQSSIFGAALNPPFTCTI